MGSATAIVAALPSPLVVHEWLLRRRQPSHPVGRSHGFFIVGRSGRSVPTGHEEAPSMVSSSARSLLFQSAHPLRGNAIWLPFQVVASLLPASAIRRPPWPCSSLVDMWQSPACSSSNVRASAGRRSHFGCTMFCSMSSHLWRVANTLRLVTSRTDKTIAP